MVFILIDDLGWRDLGCYGSTFYETPHLDALAARGALFTDAYAAAPARSPTRASLLTGRYPARVIIGGCDRGHPQSWFSPYGNPTLPDGPDDECLTDRLTDEAIALIEASGDRPFFLNLWHYAVHVPIQAPPEPVAKYEAKARDTGLAQIDPVETGEPFPTWDKRDARVRRRMVQSDPAYAAMVDNLDGNVGRLLDALDRTGDAEDTIVVLTSDNGGLSTAEGSPTSNLPLKQGKGWTEDGGVRVPLIVRWPGVVAAGTRISEPVTSPDSYPTLLAAAGLPPIPEQHVDGVDFGPALRGEPFARGPLFWHYPHYSNQGGRPSAAIRDGRWKLIVSFEGDPARLYDIVPDPGERIDLAAQRPEVAARMRDLLSRWLDDTEALLPERNRQPEPFADLPP
ncbi:sulfatase [Nonomuraea deserti]|uniref:Sulfatase n=1 Tax=Nonomuraea deserti TaxID=1848322 RepID=A0A4R4VRL7_9ACTN|nr:sulfatase [Nonomuraea deserti]